MYQFEHVLCPTDFSDSSIEAIRFAQHASRVFDGTLTLLFVDTFEKTPQGFFERDEQKIRTRRIQTEEFAESKFSEIIKGVNLCPERTRTVVRFGTTYKEIIEEAESGPYSTIALATQGIGYSSPHLIGRTAERIVRLCRTPVITIRAQKKKSFGEIKTILCPTDFSEYGNYALPYAISLAHRYAGTLILLHATDLTVTNPDKLIDRFPDPSLYHESANEIPIERLVGRDVEPENTIERVVMERGIDLIVMGTHGARGLRRVQIGNTTEEVIRRVSAPVLSITHPIHRSVFPRRFQEEYDQKRQQ
ncbi:MAG: universal stress protein [Ignavibacteria bacterium]|nr:universal stress protein [Ignavibacteria bacterium]